jgi:hypothetical protein
VIFEDLHWNAPADSFGEEVNQPHEQELSLKDGNLEGISMNSIGF